MKIDFLKDKFCSQSVFLHLTSALQSNYKYHVYFKQVDTYMKHPFFFLF